MASGGGGGGDEGGTVFVTVGTTRFDALITEITSEASMTALRDRGYRRLLLQIGAGREPTTPDTAQGGPAVEWYRYKDSLRGDMEAAALIVSHAGAGSIMESLSLQKPLVVVVNADLMDDHQQELAHALEEQGHLIATDPAYLAKTLSSMDTSRLRPRPDPQLHLFPTLVDQEMGFVSAPSLAHDD